MAGLKQIKSKIRSIDKTRTVTKAMEAVSAAKMRKAQGAALGGRAYARAAVSILARVSGSRELANHPLTRGAEGALLLGRRAPSARALYIVITADRGLAGALNSGVLRAALSDISSLRQGLPLEQDTSRVTVAATSVSIIAVGRKANEFFGKRGYAIETFHPNVDDGVSSELIAEIVGEIANRFAMGQCDLVKICYQNFLSTFEQKPTIRQIFPLSLEELEKVVGDIVPKTGAFSEHKGPSFMSYAVEPSEEEILSAILPKLASIFVYHALLETKASEHSARMVAMKSASDKGLELSHALTLQFNKARQAAITSEVSEITGGIEAMAG